MGADDRLRAASATLQPMLDPAPPSIESLEARRRRRRIRRVATGVVVVALVGALALARSRSDENTLRTTSSSTSTVTTRVAAAPIPWVDQPVTVPTGPPPGPADTSARCTAAQLHVRGVDQYGATNHSIDAITLVNTSGSVCSMSSALSAIARGTGGPPIELPAAPGDAADAGDVLPGATAVVSIEDGHACDAAQGTNGRLESYTSAELQLLGPHSRPSELLTVAVPALNGICQSIGILGLTTLTPGTTTTTAPPPPATQLHATISDVGSARPGGVLHYVVALTNSSNHAVSLSPCPSYYERVGDTPSTYQLNCVAGSIAAGATVRFAMELTLPAAVPLGLQILEWGWLPPLVVQPTPPTAPFIVGR